jgi:hypothetical protein
MVSAHINQDEMELGSDVRKRRPLASGTQDD